MAMAASDQQLQQARSTRHGFEDESRWVELIRESLREVSGEEDDDGIPVSVFDVPKQLLVHKPEAYAPQFIALGPYHHWHPHLLDDLVRELRHLEGKAQCHSQSVDESTARLTCMVTGLMKELCPFKMEGNFPEKQIERDIAKHAHLLELLYHLLVPRPKPSASENSAPAWSGPVEDDIEEQRPDGDGGQEQEGEGPPAGTGNEYVMQLLAVILSMASRLKGGRLGHVIEFAAKAPWKMLAGIPGISGLSMHADADMSQEIAIPSVTELASSGVRFKPTNGNLSTITFNRKTATLHLPAVTLDCNTEVVLRNLVAYESSAASGPLVFTRYTELMNGIIDTDDDVTHLRKRGVVINRMKKSDGEAAKLWNGMSRSVQHSKVPDLDAVIDDVNRYYGRRWSVKAKRFMRKYVLSSWKMLTFLATISMLLLTTLQAFCSVYTCSRWFTDVVVTVTPTPAE
ncbi:unnamed protein product [Triticum turgidum subsp. durum]|uniref:Uncharacterized protein n=1 Tax=Triticum turgidum subsp. durum TaxID=4567 RepID=A0A9R0WSJ0_TRITD|nr:unnamed protein product [Triticum turgidum subsp. durum]